MKLGDRLAIAVAVLLFGWTQFYTFLGQATNDEARYKQSLHYFSALEDEISYNYNKVKAVDQRLKEGKPMPQFTYVDRVYVAGLQGREVGLLSSPQMAVISPFYNRLDDLKTSLDESLVTESGSSRQLEDIESRISALDGEIFYLKNLINLDKSSLDEDYEDLEAIYSRADSMLKWVVSSYVAIGLIIGVEIFRAARKKSLAAFRLKLKSFSGVFRRG